MSTTDLLTLESTNDKFWWQYLSSYHWYVLILCALGWMFDCADQMIFTSSRAIAMRDLMPLATPEYQTFIGGWTTTLFMIGWATGGLLFGIVGDKWGRAKTMALTIFLYAAFTGLSALSRTWQEFALARFITGFGVGGEFAAGAALVADVMPQRARAQALGMLQALSALGNIAGAGMLQVAALWAGGNEHYSWRYLYWVGAAPAIIAVFVMARMKEPDKWLEAKAAAIESGVHNLGRISDLFTHPTWRRNTIVGLLLAISGVVGVWGIGFYSPELIDATFPQMTIAAGQQVEKIISAPSDAARSAELAALARVQEQKVNQKPTAEAVVAKEAHDAYGRLLTRTIAYREKLPANLGDVKLTPRRQARILALMAKRIEPRSAAKIKSNALMLQQVGAFFGMLMFSILAVRIGRRWTFALSFALAWASIFLVFLGFHDQSQIWYLYPLLGFCTLLPFGGFAVYFPELFPTRLRTTGTGFCYNVGRYVSSLGPLVFGGLAAGLVGRFETPAFRVAAVIVASIYIIGILAAFAGPETKGKALPEDSLGAV
jgi:MFS family permease